MANFYHFVDGFLSVFNMFPRKITVNTEHLIEEDIILDIKKATKELVNKNL